MQVFADTSCSVVNPAHVSQVLGSQARNEESVGTHTH